MQEAMGGGRVMMRTTGVQCTPGAHSQTSLRSSILNLRERWSSCNKSLTTRFVTTIDVFCTVHTNYCKSRALSYHVGVCNWTYELLYSSCGAYHNSLYQIIVTTYIKLLSRSSRPSGVDLSEVCRLKFKSLFLGFSRLYWASDLRLHITLVALAFLLCLNTLQPKGREFMSDLTSQISQGSHPWVSL